MHETTVQQIPYGGWDNVLRISNGIVEAVVTADVGPRVIRYVFPDRENELCEVTSDLGRTGGNEWRMYGGHRLWHSPESKPRTYQPDNTPVQWEQILNGIRATQDVESLTGIMKEIEVTLNPEGTRVTLLHRLKNLGTWAVKLSIWSVTALAPGGLEVVPITSRDTGLLPNRTVSLWPYTRMNDPRITWLSDYLLIRQVPSIADPLKIGVMNEQGWAAYFNNGNMFVKYYTHMIDHTYPDLGVSYETYVNDFMIEMETLSPLRTLEPGTSAEHREEWELIENVLPPPAQDPGIEKTLSSYFPSSGPNS